MNVQKVLYKIIKDKLPSTYNITEGVIEEFEKNICKIKLKRSNESPLIDMSGAVLNRFYDLEIYVQSDIGEEGHDKGLDFCEEVIEGLSSIFNYLYKDDEGKPTLYINNVLLEEDIENKGQNSQAVYCFNITFTIDYFEI